MSQVKAKVAHKFSDRCPVEAWLKIQVPEEQTIRRQVWRRADADWRGFEDALSEQDWTQLDHMSPNEGAEWLQDTILGLMQAWIGKRELREKKSTHPWLNDQVVALVARRMQAQGT